MVFLHHKGKIRFPEVEKPNICFIKELRKNFKGILSYFLDKTRYNSLILVTIYILFIDFKDLNQSSKCHKLHIDIRMPRKYLFNKSY